jgi:GNAT superfamily N-acetyltransferase
VSRLAFVVVDGGSVEARHAMTEYFGELTRRFPGGFDPGDALDEAATRYNPPSGLFVIARAGEQVIACGALELLDDDVAEIKRMWVSSEHRGIGLGKRLLARLEDEVARAGRSTVLLDTNGTLSEAIAMYTSCGYTARDRYNDNPYAQHWFTKDLLGTE